MTRIIAGAAGGRRLATPPGRGTRPTADRAREGLFSSLESQRGGLEGARVLDLYAGSGAVGLEALSRGAAAATLVESDAAAARVVRENLRALGLPGGRLVQAPVERLVDRLGPRQVEGPGPRAVDGLGRRQVQGVGSRSAAAGEAEYDVVFADPPYALPAAELAAALTALADAGWIASGAIVVVERASREPWMWPGWVEPLRERRYGEATLWYGRARPGPAYPSTSSPSEALLDPPPPSAPPLPSAEPSEQEPL